MPVLLVQHKALSCRWSLELARLSPEMNMKQGCLQGWKTGHGTLPSTCGELAGVLG